jgi:hypothetical protein
MDEASGDIVHPELKVDDRCEHFTHIYNNVFSADRVNSMRVLSRRLLERVNGAAATEDQCLKMVSEMNVLLLKSMINEKKQLEACVLGVAKSLTGEAQASVLGAVLSRIIHSRQIMEEILTEARQCVTEAALIRAPIKCAEDKTVASVSSSEDLLSAIREEWPEVIGDFDGWGHSKDIDPDSADTYKDGANPSNFASSFFEQRAKDLQDKDKNKDDI